MHSDRQALLQAILENPADDLLRYVFADWLEEHGEEERAEFVRLQLHLSTLHPSEIEYTELHSREQELLKQFQVQWKRELPEIRGVHWERFERGFVSTVRVDDPELFLFEAEHLFAATPIDRLRLHRTDAASIRQIVDLPQLQHLLELDLADGNFIANAGADAIADSPYLNQLRELRLRSNRLGPAGVRALAMSKSIPQLEVLDLDRNNLHYEGAEYLAEATGLKELKQLSIGWTDINDEGLRHLAQGKHFDGLQWLYLSGNRIADDGAEFLAASKHLLQLQSLYLDGNRLSDRGAIALANSPLMETVQWLYLKRNQIGDAGGLAFARSRYLRQIKELVLGENLILSAGPELRDRFGKAVWLW